MNEIKKTLELLSSLPIISSSEKKFTKELQNLAKDSYDEMITDNFGNTVFVKKSNNKNAPKLFIDAHIDNVGMMVSDVYPDGFVKVSYVGGIDSRILPATEVTIYGKKEVYGVISSTPPHLKDKNNANKAPKSEEFLIDTGYTDGIQSVVSVGDLVGYRAKFDTLINGRVIGKSFDDKACCCALLEVLKKADKDKLKYDLYISLSAQEETGKCGARFIAQRIKPDYAIITDVNFSAYENIPKKETIEIGKGASIDMSSLCDRNLSRKIVSVAKEKKIPYQIIVEVESTGTNNELILISGEGIKTAVMSVPLSSMHTYSETVDLSDIKSLADIILAFSYTEAENE